MYLEEVQLLCQNKHPQEAGGSRRRGCENSPAAKELPRVDIIGNQRGEFAEKGNGAISAVSLLPFVMGGFLPDTSS